MTMFKIKNFFTKLKPDKYSTALILSGGGARGFTHVGVLKALHEYKIFPSVICGSSAGAIVGALYADGHQPDDIVKIVKDKNFLSFLRVTYPTDGLFKLKGIASILRGVMSAKTFEELKLPLFVAATNFNTGKIRFFSKGELIIPVLASASIPIFFKPVKIDDHYYVDGGLLNNLPVEPVLGKATRIIGVNANPVGQIDKMPSFLGVIDRTVRMSYMSGIQNNIARCDIYIEPEKLKNYTILQLSKAEEIMEIGYEETMKVLEKQKKQLRL